MLQGVARGIIALASNMSVACSQTIILAKQMFRERCTNVEAKLCNGSNLPAKRKRSEYDPTIFHVHTYWNFVGLELIKMAVIYRILSKACATEAANIVKWESKFIPAHVNLFWEF